MDELLMLDAVSAQSGISVRWLREWCATGRLRCESDGTDWLIPTSEGKRAAALAAARLGAGDGDRPVALVVPADVAPRNLADEVAHRLGLEADSVAMSSLAIDGQAYVVAVWKDGHEDGGLPKLVELAEEVGGASIDGAASTFRRGNTTG
jgi:hypothetical protein